MTASLHPVVAEGDTVWAGELIATIEAMKVEAGITSRQAGTVSRVAIGPLQQLEGGDFLVMGPMSHRPSRLAWPD